MKKLLLSMAFVTLGIVAFAQKQATGDIVVESQFSLNLGGPVGWTTPYLTGKYFINEGLAARVSLSIDYSSNTYNTIDNPTTSPAPTVTPVTGTYKLSGSSFGIALGAEKHFAGSDKFSPYAGAELIFAMVGAGMTNALTGSSNNNKMNVTVNGHYKDTMGVTPGDKGSSYSTTGGGATQFGLKLVAGGDYYFTQNIYIGGELGWGFLYTSYAEQKASAVLFLTSMTSASSPASEAVISGSHSGMDIKMMNAPSATLRFGFKF